jgi:hypothetical protein
MKPGKLPRPIPPAEEPAFWMVWSPEGPTEPKVRYASPGAARYAARAMAAKNPGQTFFVLKAKIMVRGEAETVTEGWLAEKRRRPAA